MTGSTVPELCLARGLQARQGILVIMRALQLQDMDLQSERSSLASRLEAAEAAAQEQRQAAEAAQKRAKELEAQLEAAKKEAAAATEKLQAVEQQVAARLIGQFSSKKSLTDNALFRSGAGWTPRFATNWATWGGRWAEGRNPAAELLERWS